MNKRELMNAFGRLKSTNFSEQSDEALLVIYRENGSSRILGLLLQRYIHKILGLCVNYLKNYQDAQDAASEIVENLCRNLHRYEISHFERWLYFVTRNHCLKKLQRRLNIHREDISQIDPDLFVENDIPEDPYIEEKLEQLCDAIDELRDDQRRCIVLFYLEQRSYREITEMTEYDLKQVKSHIQNGRRNLKNALSKHQV